MASLSREGRRAGCPAGHGQGGLCLPGSRLDMGSSKALTAGAQRDDRDGEGIQQALLFFLRKGGVAVQQPIWSWGHYPLLSAPQISLLSLSHQVWQWPPQKYLSSFPLPFPHCRIQSLTICHPEAPTRSLSAFLPFPSPSNLLRGRASQNTKPIMSLPCSQSFRGSLVPKEISSL